MASSNSFATNKINPKLDEISTTNLIIKLKVPKLDLPSSSQDNNNTSTIISFAPNEKQEDLLEEGEIKENEDAPLTPSPPPPPAATTKKGKEKVDEDGVDLGEVKSHICPLCNKGFSNGKALGGHKRSHNLSSLSSKNNNQDDDINDNQEVYRCAHCPKEFPSLKSLFGHMKSHPNRGYRGMNPSRRQRADYINKAEAAEMAVEPSLLKTWSVTGKRGRKGWWDSDLEVVKAAETLCLMSRGGQRVDEFESDDVDYYEVNRAKKAKDKGLMTPSSSNDNVGLDDDEVYYLKNLGYLPNYEFDDVNNDNMMIFDDPIKAIVSSKNQGIKKIGKINQDENNKWICTTCGKSFATHQALGGHRSSHNKEKYNNPITNQTRMSESSPKLVNDASQDDVVAIHKCKICDKTFASGQALGGHQRSHYISSSDNSSSSGTSQSNCETGPVNGNDIDQFDLNVELALMMDEDKGDVTVDSTLNK